MIPRSIILNPTSSNLTSPELLVSNPPMAPFCLNVSPLVAAEYLAHGHMLGDQILQRAIEIDSMCSAEHESDLRLILPTDKHGISKKFLSFMTDLDKSVGQRALGPEQTVSGKVQSSLKEAHTRVKSVDEQKGYSKIAHDVL